MAGSPLPYSSSPGRAAAVAARRARGATVPILPGQPTPPPQTPTAPAPPAAASTADVWQRWMAPAWKTRTLGKTVQERHQEAASAARARLPGRMWGPWRPGILEGFILLQLLSSGLLLLPGTQPLRFPIRALPYLLSAALWFRREPTRGEGAPPGAGRWLGAALALLALELAHPETPFVAGIAQMVFQLCIAAPLFWAARAQVDARRLEGLVWLLLACYGLSAVVGLGQVYYPDLFMPRDFSSLLNDDYLESLSFEGAAGQTIFRPPGLTDLPGGAATAGAATAFLGLSLAGRQGLRLLVRVGCVALACAGLFVLYLCQVRSLLLMLVLAVICGAVVNLCRGRTVAGVGGLALLASTVVGAFLWAVRVGGDTVGERFLGLAEGGVVEGFQAERGGFFAATFYTYLPQHPLGAGLGRWGMMSTYFGALSSVEPLYVEVQLTGWLFDGGVLLWVLMAGAILAALGSAARLALFHCDERVSHAATAVLCLNLLVLGQSFAGPVFNTQLGILFWFLTGVLHAAAGRVGLSQPVTSLGPCPPSHPSPAPF